MSTNILKAPFPWFGGKSRVAHLVWPRFGDVNHYCEPFFGSGAVMLARPDDHEHDLETVNDLDGFVANFWRATQHDPEAVATHAAHPVNEVDLEARHRWLCRQPEKSQFLERMKLDPDYYDVQRAGWWVWGICSWIGTGWCAGNYYPENHEESNGKGVCKDTSKRPHLGDGGMGVNRAVCDGGEQARIDFLMEWFTRIRDRFSKTRVCCGDWKRICTDGALNKGAIKGVFLDPPYADKANRTANLYREDSTSVAHAVREWAIDHGDRPNFRIALCGYDSEHVMPDSWECVKWKASGGYGNFSKGERKGAENAIRERIWFSPHCLKEDSLNNFELK